MIKRKVWKSIRIFQTFLFLVQTDRSKSFLKLYRKQECCKCYCNKISNRFRHITSHGLICCKNMRHDIDQRNQKYEFSHNSNNNRRNCFSKRVKSHLAGNLNSKHKHKCHVKTNSLLCKYNKSWI